MELEWVRGVNEEGKKNQANHNNLEKKCEKKNPARCETENGKLTAMKWAMSLSLCVFE